MGVLAARLSVSLSLIHIFINPENIDEYIAFDGYAALGKVLTEMTPEQVIQTVLDSGLRDVYKRQLLRIAGVTVTVKGQENIPKGRAVVFTPNHQGDYDIPLMLMYLDEPHALVAKIETKKIPLVRTWMKLLDCVFIDRKSPRHSMEAMRQAQALVQAGESAVSYTHLGCFVFVLSLNEMVKVI